MATVAPANKCGSLCITIRCCVWVALFLAMLPQQVLNDPDVFWHIKTGEWIITNHTFPRVDVFSYTAAGQEWIDQEWLAQVIYALTYRAGGWIAIDVLAAALVATTFTIVFSRLKVNFFWALLITTGAFWFAST